MGVHYSTPRSISNKDVTTSETQALTEVVVKPIAHVPSHNDEVVSSNRSVTES